MHTAAMQASAPGLKNTLKESAQRVASRFGPHRYGNGSPKLWILMYHRILPASDPRFASEEPGMIVTPDTFRQHLRQLKELFTLLPLAQWIEHRRSGKQLPKRSCAVTFDDGWLDNYEHALPILEREQVPATIFAVSHMIGTRREFWPNRMARIVAADPQLNHPALQWLRPFSGNLAASPGSRDWIAALINSCKRLSDDELNSRLDESEAALMLPPPQSPALLSWDQLRDMQRSGLVNVGSHTCNHYRLVANLDAQTMSREISESRRMLEEQLGTPITLFCYPNGDASSAAIELVRQHYAAAVTTRRGINTSTVDDYTLARIGVHEDITGTPTSFQARLSGWL
ncbi:MAG TPA: polysaccharide deacetylase family protein [Steroidobacteraceae bacterium]|jgi:peptidoglycan/xylan/chitin deacetylase (PgdA/CDA1 family)